MEVREDFTLMKKVPTMAFFILFNNQTAHPLCPLHLRPHLRFQVKLQWPNAYLS